MYNAEIDVSDRDAVPAPTGYHVLIAVPSVEEKTSGGIFRPDQLRDLEQTASIFGYVLAIGPATRTNFRQDRGARKKTG